MARTICFHLYQSQRPSGSGVWSRIFLRCPGQDNWLVPWSLFLSGDHKREPGPARHNPCLWHTSLCCSSQKLSFNCCVLILEQHWKLTGNTNLCSLSCRGSETSFYWTGSESLISILGFCFSSTAHHKSDQIVGFLLKTFPSKNKIWSLIIQ